MDRLDQGLYHGQKQQCRTCFNPSDDLQSLQNVALVDTSRQMSYGELLKEVAHIDITDEKWKEMPQYICNCCSHQLYLSHAFIKQALEVNDKLWSLLDESELDIKTCLEIKIESEEVVEQSCEETMRQCTFQVKTELSGYDSLSDGASETYNNNGQQMDNEEQCSALNETNHCDAYKLNILSNEMDSCTPKEEPKRKKYKVSSQEERVAIVNAASRGGNWVSLASSLGINYKTAHRWVSSGRTESKPRGGRKSKKLTEDQVSILLSWVENDSNLTLEQLTGKIRTQFNISVSPTTVGNYLEGRLYSCKRFEGPCHNDNSSENKMKRAEYVQMLDRYNQEGKQVLWIGEINFNLFCRMSRGRPRSQSSAEQLPAPRGPNVHLIGAITSAGVLLLERLPGFPAITCIMWLYHILQKWHDVGNNARDLVIVCDNAPYYSDIEAMVDAQSAGRATVLRLPSNSAMLNPIESIWTKVKRNVRTNAHMSNVQGPVLREQSLKYLERAVDEAMATITEEDCGRAVQQASTFHADALSLNDIQVGI